MQRQNPHIWCRKCYELRNRLPVSVVKDIKCDLKARQFLEKISSMFLSSLGHSLILIHWSSIIWHILSTQAIFRKLTDAFSTFEKSTNWCSRKDVGYVFIRKWLFCNYWRGALSEPRDRGLQVSWKFIGYIVGVPRWADLCDRHGMNWQVRYHFWVQGHYRLTGQVKAMGNKDNTLHMNIEFPGLPTDIFTKSYNWGFRKTYKRSLFV